MNLLWRRNLLSLTGPDRTKENLTTNGTLGVNLLVRQVSNEGYFEMEMSLTPPEDES
jgi:hypothetical protein